MPHFREEEIGESLGGLIEYYTNKTEVCEEGKPIELIKYFQCLMFMRKQGKLS